MRYFKIRSAKCNQNEPRSVRRLPLSSPAPQPLTITEVEKVQNAGVLLTRLTRWAVTRPMLHPVVLPRFREGCTEECTANSLVFAAPTKMSDCVLSRRRVWLRQTCNCFPRGYMVQRCICPLVIIP